jgi:hypothetical protein
MSIDSDVLWTALSKCVRCGEKKDLVKLPTSNPMHTHTATVWNGIQWLTVKHGTKKCVSCDCRYKLNYVAKASSKQNTINDKTLTEDSIILLHPHIGFTVRYLTLYWHRVCRASVSALAEASTIILANPTCKVGHVAKKHSKKSMTIGDHVLAKHITTALFNYLRLKEKVYTLDVTDPVPKNDPYYDPPLKDVHIIFNELENDLQAQRRGKIDIVTDGNMPLSRSLSNDEKTGLKRLQGRPRNKKTDTHKRKKKNSSRCSAVVKNKSEDVFASRTRTGGLFGTVNMRTGKSGHGNRILQLAEMKNSECKPYKIALVKELIKKKVNGKRIKVGKYAHDCACVLRDEFDGKLCDKCYLDSYHAKKHKCGMASIDTDRYPNLNSQAAEQLWAKLEKLQSTISHFSRPHYRFFLKNLCQWRNDFISRHMRSDQNPIISKRRATKRNLG